MKFKKFFKDERGAVLPIVALFILFVAFGISALVIDVGTLYVERRNMVAAADAGALAGAREMQNRTSGTEKIIEIAKNVAVANGAEGSTIIVNVYTTGTRYVEVIANKNTELFFAKTFGMNSSNVQAIAKAKPIVLNPGVLPFAALQSEVYVNGISGAVNTNLMLLHDERKLTSDNSWGGLIDLDGTMGDTNDIVKAIEDRYYELGQGFTTNLNQNIMNSAPGWKNFQDSIPNLFDKARAFTSDATGRRAYVTGFVPIVDASAYDPSSKKVLPIIAFAEFTILDLAQGTDSIQPGLSEAFMVHLDANFQIQYEDGLPRVDYETGAVGDSNRNQYKLTNTKMAYVLIGVYTGKILSINDIIKGNYEGTLYNEARFDAVTLID